MKFIHTADIHLGAAPDGGKLYSDVREREIWDTFSELIKVCEEEKTDVLLIAGDLFHRQPLMRDLKEVDSLFSGLTHTKVVLIAGNHDWLKKDSCYRKFTWSSHVYPLMSGEMECAVFKELQLAVYGFSYEKREITEALYDRAKAPGKFPREILLAHGGDAKHIPINKERLAGLGYDYVALGHIHKPQVLIEGKAAYAGALEPIDSGDVGVHGYISGEITSQGTRLCFVPFASRSYVHFAVKVTRKTTNAGLKAILRREIKERGMEHMYKVILRGFRAPDMIFRLQELDVFGNILEIQDDTKPDYDFARLEAQNTGNLLGNYIAHFRGAEEGSLEAEALYEGVTALLGD